MATCFAFQAVAGQFLTEATSTPCTPFQLAGNVISPNQQIRIIITDASASTVIVHIAWGQTATIASNIAGAGGAPAAGQTPGGNQAGLMTFLGSEIEVLGFPTNAWFSIWCEAGGSTADVYMTPGEGV